jgi:DNA-binding HxlR family transcriptional regulator
MSDKRSYQQFCGVARALDVVGERWTLLIVRDLLLGPRRYSDLLRSLAGITTNLLAKRLAELEQGGTLEKRVLPPPSGSVVYALTETGMALEPVVMELGRFGARTMDAPRRGDRVDLRWALLSTKRRYRGGVARVIEVRPEDGRRFELVFTPERLSVSEVSSPRADAAVEGSADQLRVAFASSDRTLADRAARSLVVRGERAAWREAYGSLQRSNGR